MYLEINLPTYYLESEKVLCKAWQTRIFNYSRMFKQLRVTYVTYLVNMAALEYKFLNNYVDGKCLSDK